MSLTSEVVVRAYTTEEADVALTVRHNPAPLVFPGQVLRCTNANASEFSHMQRYRIERMYSGARGGVALAAVRNDAGHLRVIPSTAWAFKHWELVC